MKQHNRCLFILIVILTCGYCSSALAKTENEDDFQWFASLGLTIGTFEGIYTNPYSEVIEGNEEPGRFSNLELELRLQYKDFFIEAPGSGLGERDGLYAGPSLGYTFYSTDYWSFDAFYGVSGGTKWNFSNPNETFIIEREPDKRLGLRATGYFDKVLTQFIISPVSLKNDIGGYSFSASIRRDWQIRNINLYASLGAHFASSEIWNYYYGISIQDAARISEANRYFDTADALDEYFSPTEIASGTRINARIGFEYPISESWVFGGYYGAVKFAKSVENSPFRAGDSSSVVAGLSIHYVF